MRRLVGALLALGVLVAIDADSMGGGGPEHASDVSEDEPEVAEALGPDILWWTLRSRWWRGIPEQPTTPTLSDISHDSMTVSWTAPESGAFEIVDYDVQYRDLGAYGAFVGWIHDGTRTEATITGLAGDTGYGVRVRAVSEVGVGDWSEPVVGMTLASLSFLEGDSADREFDENAAPGVAIGAPVRTTVTDGGLRYRLSGADAGAFAIATASGQLRTRHGEKYDYETRSSYAVEVEADHARRGSARIAVRISVLDVDEPPGKPGTPSVAASGETSLEVTWAEPSNEGPAITGYDVEYRPQGVQSYLDAGHTGTGTRATITGLAPEKRHEVRVRAMNDEGTGEWSDTGEGKTSGSDENRAVLEAFYRATGGANWKDNLNWMTEAPLAEWYGVEVDSLGQVIGLGLSQNNLTGVIPTELGSLSSLVRLHLSGNSLRGSMPTELGNLRNLTHLWLDRNGLTGTIPARLGNLANMRSMNLNLNALTGEIPRTLGALPSLNELFLNNNRLTGQIPASFLRLALDRFWWVDNADLCVPGTAEFKTWLGEIRENRPGPSCASADREALEALYRAMGGRNWTNQANWMTDAPLGEWHGVDVDGQGRVIQLRLQSNNLTGEIPSAIGDLAKLLYLRLDLNRLTGTIPPELGNLAGLTSMNVNYNGLTGRIPWELGALSSLNSLFLNNNRLTGQIPASLLRLPLDLFWWGGGNTGLCAPDTAEFQTWLGDIRDNRPGPNCSYKDRAALEALYKATGGPSWTNRSNWTTDAPLRSWHGVTTDSSGRVVGIDLHKNNLTGSIPRELGTVSRLRVLSLWGNRLSGSIPRELGNLPSLGDLNLWGNRLSGAIPRELGNLVSLWQLSLADNELTGSIPSELGNLGDTIVVLDLQRNRLSGRIPFVLTRLCNLQRLHLNQNRLHGALPLSRPSCFGRDLKELNLHDNNLSGVYPSWLMNLTKLDSLTLDPDRTCLPANGGFRDWVHGLHRRNVLAMAHTPAYCGEGFWFTWRFEQTTTGRGWTGARPFAAHRINGEPMLLRIFMGMDNNDPGSWAIQSPQMKVSFQRYARVDPNAPTVDVPANAISLSATRDQAFRLDTSYRRSINILIPGDLTRRGRTPQIRIDFDSDRTFRKIVGNRMPALENDRTFAPLDWVRRIDFGQHYEILSGNDVNPRAGWPTQEMPPAKVYLVALYKSQSDDRGMIRAVRDLVGKGPRRHRFFLETQHLLPIKDLEVHGGRGLRLGYHPTHDNRSKVLAALGINMAFSTWDNGFDYVVGLRPGRGGVARLGKRSSVVGYNGGSGSNALAHELGHNMNLKHAPCGDPFPKNVDDDYPWRHGTIGPTDRRGFNVRGIDLDFYSLRHNRMREWDRDQYMNSIDRPVLLDPEETGFVVRGTYDLMSYCARRTLPETWISAYHFDKALNYRQPATSSFGQLDGAARTKVLLLAGGRSPDGELFFYPSFVGEAEPQLPETVGEYRIVGRDTRGTGLFTLDFDMTEVADGGGASSFLFAVPVRQEWANALARITLTGPEGWATLDEDRGVPGVLLRDSTGEVRGVLLGPEDGALTPRGIAESLGDPDIENWDVQVSRGIPSASHWRR